MRDRHTLSASSSLTGPIRFAILTNEPAPYRVVPYSILGSSDGVALKVFYFTRREPTRSWDLPPMGYDHEYLRGQFIGKYHPVHFNIGIWKALRSFRPSVIMTTGYNPSHLIAYAFARFQRIPHIAMTDGTTQSEASLSAVHRFVRREIYRHSVAFVGPCKGSLELFRSYGVPENHFFRSPLCANNDAFRNAVDVEKKYDFIFSGRFSDRKCPLFALEVVHAVSRLIGRSASIVFIGDGELEGEMRAMSRAKGVDAHFLGFAKQSELPERYKSARILLFPTLWDPWGVVANEACAAGLPVIVSPVAGAAGELIIDGFNGHVLSMNVDAWAKAASMLLTDSLLYSRMSVCASNSIEEYSYVKAAAGMLDAARSAVTNGGRRHASI